ncbi:MAG: hypothetical protein IKC75_03880, partial [Clostridia bacterium]|nr:hypothetical protein [Clostridia bacterium]
MMEITVAKNAGFCPGVRAATDRLSRRIEAAAPGERIFTLGHLIHNEEYNKGLAARGVLAIEAKDLEALADGATAQEPVTVFVRAHGITREVRALLERLSAEHDGFSFVDCTCPFVTKIHRIAEEMEREGKHSHIFIGIGNAVHPEVEGFMSCFEGEKLVFADAAELEVALSGTLGAKILSKMPVMVAQTTQKLTEWKKCQKLLKKDCTNALIFDTICNVTDSRQKEAAALAAASDGMVVIGGRESSNTAKLFDVCRAACPDTLRVMSTADLPLVKTFSLTHRKV